MAGREPVRTEVMKWLAIAVAIAGVGVITALTQNASYSKEQSDRFHDRIMEHHDKDVDRLYDGIDQIQRNVDWLVRQQGGEPIRSEEEGQ